MAVLLTGLSINFANNEDKYIDCMNDAETEHWFCIVGLDEPTCEYNDCENLTGLAYEQCVLQNWDCEDEWIEYLDEIDECDIQREIAEWECWDLYMD